MAELPILNVHERLVELPIEGVRALLADLGGPADRIWPGDHWPPLVLDNGTELGSRGGHGFVRYHVSARTPDLLEFTFDPPFGLVGAHRFELTAAGSHTLIRHVIEAEPVGSMRLGWPLVVRPSHDAVLEELFDRLEQAAGKSIRTPWSWRVREIRRAFTWSRPHPRSRPQQAIGWTAATALGGIAALHLLWASGRPWPLATKKEFAEKVVGSAHFPPAAASIIVAAGLGAAAAATARPASASRRILALGTAAALLARSSSIVLAPLLSERHPSFQRADRRLYAPLCLALGVGILTSLAPRPGSGRKGGPLSGL